MSQTNPLTLPFGSGKPSGVVVADVFDEPHAEWVLVLVFKVGAGVTELVSQLICPKLDYFETDRDRAYKWLVRLINALPLTGDMPEMRLSSRMARGAPVATLERFARAWIAARAAESYLFRPGQAGDADRRPRGPKGGGDVRLARIARQYVDLLGEERPVEALAAANGIARSTAQSYLYRARERDLLTSAGRGRAGGELTERAQQLLNQGGN